MELPENSETIYTATNGSNATLQCPTPPGLLRQHYSVQWKKGYAVVAALISSSIAVNTAPRHSINETDYSLIIEDVQFDDASSSYKCEVFVTDPLSFNGQTRIRLETVPLVLQVNDNGKKLEHQQYEDSERFPHNIIIMYSGLSK